ncbi:hypothetical protein [Helicobacter pylori]|uniref:hypothetical protein n=1 Tax=Helicobacter pylori TaxID=210 RepID=UPI0035C71835
MRKVTPFIWAQSENQTLPTGNISLGSPIVFSGWALHRIHKSESFRACEVGERGEFGGFWHEFFKLALR